MTALSRLMLDLFSGRGGASAAMRDLGWRVVSVDNNPDMQPDIVADISTWSYDGPSPDLIWASPPCTDFARESMPWNRTGQIPSLDLVRATWQIIADVRPRYWVIENVRGAVPYLTPLFGMPQRIGPYYLWGNIPKIKVHLQAKPKSLYSGRRPDLRAMIPYELSLAVAMMIECQMPLFTDMSVAQCVHPTDRLA